MRRKKVGWGPWRGYVYMYECEVCGAWVSDADTYTCGSCGRYICTSCRRTLWHKGEDYSFEYVCCECHPDAEEGYQL